MTDPTFPAKYKSLVPGTITAEQACKLGEIESWGKYNLKFDGNGKDPGDVRFIDVANGILALANKDGSIGLTTNEGVLVVSRTEKGAHTTVLGSSLMKDGTASPLGTKPSNSHMLVHLKTAECDPALSGKKFSP